MSVLDKYSCEGQMSLFDPDTWCGRMFQVPSQVTKEQTSKPSLKKQQKWQKGMPAYLDLRAESGPAQDASWEMGGALLGEYTMLSFGECPSAENVSLLSQILEEKPHPKYSLSARACQGILNRANRRGKKLPPQLEQALIRQATPLKSGGGREIDSKGHKAGKGALVQTELSGTLGVSQDQTLIQTTSDGSEVAGTLDASYYKGCGERQGIERTVVYGISAYESNAMKSSNPNSGVYVADTTRTLDNNGGNPACNQGGMIVLEGNGSRPSHRGDGYAESDTMYTLNGTEHHAVCVDNGQLAQARLSDKVGALNCMHDQQAVLTYKPSVGALCMDDYKGPNRQYVDQDKLQISGSIVRRLTPLECERLQGFPDHWTDIGEWVDTKGKLHKDADSPRYKALGNSIALPFWQWMAGRMVSHLGEHPTMASLFDGIGGFPLVFSRCGVKPVWASEIEEFPIAVTKKRFPDM